VNTIDDQKPILAAADDYARATLRYARACVKSRDAHRAFLAASDEAQAAEKELREAEGRFLKSSLMGMEDQLAALKRALAAPPADARQEPST